MNADVCVIGAGPAGLAAAAYLAQHGFKVTVVDEMHEAGGRLLGQLHYSGVEDKFHRDGWWIGRTIAEDLFNDAKRAGVDFRLGSSVWGLFPEWRVCLAGPGSTIINARYVILATGAAEVPVPIPGWTLPGSMSIGAAQVMVTQHRVLPGQRVLIAGIDVLSLAIARELQLGGVEVVGVVNVPDDLVPGSSEPARILQRLGSASHLSPSKITRLAGQLLRYPVISRIASKITPHWAIRAWGIPIQPMRVCTEIRGDREVSSAIVHDLKLDGRLGAQRELDVDAVCIAGGLRPLTELAMVAGCKYAHVPELGGIIPLHGHNYETSASGVFVAGNMTGIESATVALAQGRAVGAAIATPDRLEQFETEVQKARSEAPISFMPEVSEGKQKLAHVWRKKGKRRPEGIEVQPSWMPATAQARDLLSGFPEDLVLCRCEDVTVGKIREAKQYGLVSAEELKRFTRMTMGHCQGRICQEILATLVTREFGSRHHASIFPSARPPVRPVTVGELAAVATGDEERERLVGNLRAEMDFGEPSE
jgi:sarcosine oxidase, subunit alpha